MERRELGRSGENVPTIGMGTWKIGSFSSAEERVSQVAALKKGLELGMNLIDTAEMYHSGRSEEVVRDAVSGIRESVFIASKVSPEHLRYDDVISACGGSLRRLGTSYVDLYQVHWPNSSIPIKETMRAMRDLVGEGKVRHVGVSNFSVRETDGAREALGNIELVSNQVEYSLTARGPETDILPYCSREGISLIAYSPLTRGNIPKIPRTILDRHKVTPAQATLNWVTRDESVIAIPKAASVEHLAQNASSVDVRFSEEEYEEIGRA